ncbi:progranulin-like isoform X2 [Thalassophryne amazonica]|uniref:progranulin-like isoform X2 n=1 Tax=Thalassophryne amazonica TaxID=390379 RepID=UPI0014725016|nr:progranulin-like isoform X2 [Thalassophryne amazonica]
MLLLTLWMFVGVTGWNVVSSVLCPDGKRCPDLSTCCPTSHGYGCCIYPQAVCCADGSHCCPSGYHCNLLTMMCEKENQPWMNVPMLKELAEGEPQKPVEKPDNALISDHSVEKQNSNIVYCDNYHYCYDGTTCCRYTFSGWYCCPYSPGQCCRDGLHCCPFGYDCDSTFTHCVRRNLRYPFLVKQEQLSVPASHISTVENNDSHQEMRALSESTKVGVIRCDSEFYCSDGTSCCKVPGSTSQWNCCPYKLGQCCNDGKHCCPFNYTCDPTSKTCQQKYNQVPFETKPAKKD